MLYDDSVLDLVLFHFPVPVAVPVVVPVPSLSYIVGI